MWNIWSPVFRVCTTSARNRAASYLFGALIPAPHHRLFDFPVPGPPLQGLLILAAFLESVGALLLLVGAYTRIVAFILSGEMAFAYFMANAPRGFYPLANGGEGAILFCFIFLYITFAGGGLWSVDRTVLKQD
jgi:putative oxidoreductase